MFAPPVYIPTPAQVTALAKLEALATKGGWTRNTRATGSILFGRGVDALRCRMGADGVVVACGSLLAGHRGDAGFRAITVRAFRTMLATPA